ncbi:sensor domain-containing diguanylate cyclase [Niveibacterium sp. SC-1]|uniref:sensor domain-containing diguanylate cyclase n=1 Tax=Niveibacterium sp. SC-1 TaxID=3135646 RepID=UPI00311F348C
MPQKYVTSLRRLLEGLQRRLSLNAQRGLLLLFVLVQALFVGGYLTLERVRIYDGARHSLRNTALLQAQYFETSMDAMRYQLRVVGNALLLNHTVPLEEADSFIGNELKKDWLDAVIVFNEDGDFVARGSSLPFSQILCPSALEAQSFRNAPLFKELRQKGVTEHLFYWHSEGTDPRHAGFAVYRAIRDPQGRYLGGIVGHLNATTLAKLFTRLNERGLDLGPRGVMAVIDRGTGTQLARMGSELKYAPDPALAPPFADFASDTVWRTEHYGSPYDGVERMGVFLNLNERKWVLAVALSERDLLWGWHVQVGLALVTFSLMALLQWLLLHYAHTNFLHREHLAQAARRDALTDLANRRHFNEWAQGACCLARRHHQPLCVLAFDLDHFKKINDSYGHDGGDAVLKHVAHALRGLVRESDFAARFGGEEFVVALPQTELDAALQVAERIRAGFATQAADFRGQAIHFTASFGLALVRPDELEQEDGIHAALARADMALYASKQAGRNRVTVAD